MKRIMMLAIVALAFIACKNDKAKVDNTAELQRDSLNQIIAQRDAEINDMMATLNEIENGFREINAAQSRVNTAKDAEGVNQKERIRENITYIQSTMQQNRGLINKLQKQLRESSFKSEELKKTIENMMLQLQEKDQQLQQLRAELDAKDIHITELDEQIAGLNTNVERLNQETEQKAQTITTQDKQIHTAWFVFGTKNELKEQKILVDGKVLQDEFNRNYFTKIDIRVDREIKLYSSYAKMLTSHPSSSYTLQRDANKQYVLRITNPQVFWSTSKFLVVLVK